MPRLPASVTIALCLAGCTPARFAWQAPTTPDLATYRASFEAAAGTRFVAALPLPALLARLQHERLLWLGDHHQSARLHARQLALLEALAARGVAMSMLLEAIGTEDDADVRAFLAGEFELDTLRERVRQRWSGTWLDAGDVDHDYYLALLGFARDHRVPVAGLEPTPRLPLAQRDAFMAGSVRTALRTAGNRLLVVVVGQAHLAGVGDLPRRCAAGGLRLGGEPVPALLTARPLPPPVAGDAALQSDTGFWWFRDLLEAAPTPP